MLTHDAIIIGFGKAGKTLAARLANKNWNVAMIEKILRCTAELVLTSHASQQRYWSKMD